MSKLRSAITYANVVSTLALFVALGGASYAAIKIPKNSVDTKHIKKGAITRDKIRNGAVGTGKIRDGSLTTEDFNEDEVPEGEPGRDGLDGFDGRDGLDGATGETGPPANPEWWAAANGDGTGVRGTALANGVTRTGTGTYQVNFAGDRRACGLIASLASETPGSVTAGPGANENVDVVVRTFNDANAAADRAFNVTARC